MHEFSIASSIVENVLTFCEAQGARRVLEVRLCIGELTQVDAEQLRFCIDAIGKETPMDGTAIEIDPAYAAVKCRHCHYDGAPKYWEGALSGTPVPTLECPECGMAAEATRGHECAITKVKFLRDDVEAAA